MTTRYLVNMLNAHVTPLSERMPEQSKISVKRASTKAAISQHERTLARYKAAMGDGWLTTIALEDKLGVGRSCVIGTLAKWEAKGIVERRKPCADREWNKKKGYEWRIK